MNKVLTSNEAITQSTKLRSENKTIVLVGGCFDIIHIGHIIFLEKAKEQADILMVLLESDAFITTHKGNNRPVHSQQDRIHILSALSVVDYIVPLNRILSDAEYDDLTNQLKPAI